MKPDGSVQPMTSRGGLYTMEINFEFANVLMTETKLCVTVAQRE